jgi:ATPase FliI/YscN family
MTRLPLMQRQAHPIKVNGPVIEAKLFGVHIGEICEIHSDWTNTTPIAKCQVLGFINDITILSLIGSVQGLTRDMVISPTGMSLSITLHREMAGAVISPTSSEVTVEDKTVNLSKEVRGVNGRPPAFNERRGIDELFVTGVRAIDGLLACGYGQRMGIFASAGCGKTTLMHMLINNASADLFIVALIGERGREVTEFVEELEQSGRKNKCIVVYATSDFSALDRVNAAAMATTIAEYFRDQGLNVVLFLDSITRYARALRDVALSSGEAPARRGYPASVFEKLPALLERPGRTFTGSITAFYTILLESDDEADPIAEEIRSILDGHIYLSRKLAGRDHYPAIDVLKSISRVNTRVSDQRHIELNGKFRQLLSEAEELQMLIEFGEYKPGENMQYDKTYKKIDEVRQFLCQKVDESEQLSDTLAGMRKIAG